LTSIAEERFQTAIDSYWATREAQTAKQLASGRADAGTRGSVTGGAHLHALTELLGEIFIENGFPRHSIRLRGMELPGFYRPTKNWDLVVVEGDLLVAAIELKSQVGSVGNNFNNRTEEAIGNAIDLRRAHQAGLLGRVPPWLGYVFVLEESPQSNNPVRIASTPFNTDERFAGTSYRDRYQVLCRRLVSDGLYDAACFVTTSRVTGSRMTQPDPALSFAALQQAIAERTAFVRKL
jgi:restriction endonuclease XhoI-like protein